eukprot:429778_1
MGVSSSRNMEDGKPLVSVTTSLSDGEALQPTENENNGHANIQLKQQVQKIKIPIQIEGLQGCKPTYLEFTKNTSVTKLQKTLNTKLGVEQNTLQVIGCAKIPKSFSITIGDENRYDFGNKIFIIHRKTTFIEYFNDLLQAAKDYVKMNENNDNNSLLSNRQSKTNDIIRNKGNLQTCLKSNKLIIDNNITIQFNKTLRISKQNKNKQVKICPKLGIFNVFKVNNYIHKIPKHWIKRNGLIIPLWQKEALCLSFECLKQSNYVIKIAMDKINAMNGNKLKYEYLSSNPLNCAVLPELSYLNGYKYNGQFIAMPLGQEHAHNDTGIMEIEIYEKYNDNAHISIEKEVLYSLKEYDKKLLILTPKQAGFKTEDKVYLFSHEIPMKLWRVCSVIDAMYSNENNMVYVHCNNKNIIPKWVRMIHDEIEYKNEYLIQGIGYENENDWKYKIEIFNNGFDIGIQLNKNKYKCMYLGDKLLNENESLSQQGVVCGDMISKILISNEIVIFIKGLNNNNECIELNVWTHFTINKIKNMIMEKYELLSDELDKYILTYNNCNILNSNKKLMDYNMENKDILKCVLKEDEKKCNEINLMDVKEVCVSKYNHRCVTRIYVNIVNGLMWKQITGKELPKTDINVDIYKQYGYIWDDLFEEKTVLIENVKEENKQYTKKQKKYRKIKPKMPPIAQEKKDIFEPNHLHQSTNDTYVRF